MKKPEISEYEIKGKKLICPFCGQKRFWIRKTLMNTPGVTFLGFDWANKEAVNYVCEKCGYIMWFLPPENN